MADWDAVARPTLSRPTSRGRAPKPAASAKTKAVPTTNAVAITWLAPSRPSAWVADTDSIAAPATALQVAIVRRLSQRSASAPAGRPRIR